MSFSVVIKNLYDSLLDFIYPRTCLICQKKITADNESQYIKLCCSDCFNSFEYVDNKKNDKNKLTIRLNEFTSYIANVYSLFSSKSSDDEKNKANIMNLIYSLKYSGLYKLGPDLGKLLGEVVLENSYMDYDLIIPVPLHNARLRERGYNQSDYIAKGVSKILDVKVERNVLYRKRNNVSQTTLTGSKRIENVKDLFAVRNSELEKVSGKNILLIDDVFTTGSTLSQAALALLENNAYCVNAATIVLREE